MAIEFECPACEATIRVKDEAAGKKGRCPKCQTLLLVPDPGPEEDIAAESAPPVPVLPAPAPPSPAPVAPPVPLGFPPLSAMPPTVEMPTVAAAHQPATPDPASPFGIVTQPEPLIRPAPTSRRSSALPTAKIISAVVGLLCMASVLAVGWWLYRSSKPDLAQQVVGERLRQVSLPPTSFALPAEVSKEDAERVMARLAADPLALKSEYVAVSITARSGRVQVAATPGSQAAAVRVELADNPAIRAAIAKQKKAIAETKRKELAAAAAELFADYAAALNEKTSLSRLPKHRDAVALNATTGVVGYAVEAMIAEHPFRCIAEDEDGNCYFFLPPKTKKFRLRGRELPDGTTPLPIDFEVTVKEGSAETVTVETGEPTEEPAGTEASEDPSAETPAADKPDDAMQETPPSEGAMSTPE